MPALAGDEVESRHGDALRAAWAEDFEPLLHGIAAIEGAHELLAGLRRDGTRVVLASSGRPAHVEAFLDVIDGRSVTEGWTTSEDVERTKPDADLFRAALHRLDDSADPPPRDSEVVVVGDSTWDRLAAGRLGARSYAVRTGGFAATSFSGPAPTRSSTR